MTCKDRLIELIRGAKKNTKGANCDLEREHLFADYLIENGVIVLPCKVGDSVYVPFDDKTIQELETVILTIESDKLFLNAVCKCDFENCDNVCADGKVCGMHFEYKEIGKTVFLTKEEAEQKLRKEQENVDQ